MSESASHRPTLPRRRGSNTARLGLVLICFSLGACSTTARDPAGASAVNAPAPAPTQAPTAPGAAQPAAFDTVIKGAERLDGLLPVWTRQDKVWLELQPQMFNRPLFLSPKLSSGIGEGGVLGGLMQSRWAQVGRPQWVEFRKVNQQVQLLAVNATYIAQQGSPQARSVQAAFSPSLVAAAPLASGPQAQSGAVLVDASALLLADWLGLGAHLQRQYRQSYAFDARQSHVAPTRQLGRTTVFEVVQHFASPSIAAATAPATPGAPVSSVPRALPDPRSLFVRVQHSLSLLPEQPMPTRLADPRVGYFTSSVVDFTDDLDRSPRRAFINRWRLQKKDPQAALSEPVQPIVFWLDANVPEAYRGAITEGVLAWNRAFEAIGYRGAIEVRVSPADAAHDTLATGQASIRWMTNAQAAFGAIGPTHVDPRTGEILDADIALESLSTRGIRQLRAQFMNASASMSSPLAEAPDASTGAQAHAHCEHGQVAAEQLDWALEQLSAVRPLEPDSPEVQAFVLAYLKDTTMHEVGHALGLRHNFRASRWRTPAELNDLKLTTEHGKSASVMDYAPVNLPPPGQSGGALFQTTLGPYDFWAVEYGYADLPADPAEAARKLRDIAARSAEPRWSEALAYGTDEDDAQGIDPQALTFDLGRDPIAFARTRLALARDLVARTENRVPTPLDDAAQPRRVVAHSLREMARTAQILLRQVGGVVIRRDAPGARRDPIDPLPSGVQREALGLLISEWLGPRPLPISPPLLRRLAPEHPSAFTDDLSGLGAADVSVAEQQLALQRAVLARLMSQPLADRLLDNRDRSIDRDPRPLLPGELHQRLHQSLWLGPASASADQASWRRNLQREHVARLSAGLLQPGSQRADVRALWQDSARQLLRHLQQARGGDALERAHRQACIESLNATLSATVLRSGL